MSECVVCGRPGDPRCTKGDLCEHHNDPRTQWKTISDIEECFEEKVAKIERLEARERELEAALKAAEPCILALRDTQRAMGHDYVCDDVAGIVAAALKGDADASRG